IVVEGRLPDLAERGDVIAESEVKIHSYYDAKIKAEEAYRIVSVDDIRVNVGYVITAQQVSRYKTDYGDSLFKVEPAFEFVTVPEGLEFTPGDVASASELDRLEKLGLEFETKRAIVNNQETFVVTAAAKLPFAKGDIVSSTEFQMFHEKYPGRF